MGPLLGPPPPPSFEPLVTALINEVAGQPDADELLLVLDDYHVISSQLVHESLGFLLEHRPLGLQLALTSRSDPPLALARLRARGRRRRLAGPVRGFQRLLAGSYGRVQPTQSIRSAGRGVSHRCSCCRRARSRSANRWW